MYRMKMGTGWIFMDSIRLVALFHSHGQEMDSETMRAFLSRTLLLSIVCHECIPLIHYYLVTFPNRYSADLQLDVQVSVRSTLGTTTSQCRMKTSPDLQMIQVHFQSSM